MTNKIFVITLFIIQTASNAIAQTPARPADQPRSVTLPLAEFNRLLDLAARAPVPPIAAPMPAVVASADLRITVDRETARGAFNLSGQVLQAGINRVPLLTGATVIDASSGASAVPLVTDGQTVQALVSGPGPFALTLQWGGPLVFRPGRASFVLPVPQAGAARATIDLPGEQADVRLSAGLITRRSAANGRTIIEATLDPGSATEVWWSMRDSTQVAQTKDVRALADILTLITLEDSDVRMSALIDVTVTQGELRALTAQLPDGYELQSISGSSLESFAPLASEVVLTIGNPAARSHQFLVTLARSHAGGTFTLDTGMISLKDVQRERGEIGVEGVGTLDLSAAERPGVHRIDVRELNSSLHALARMPLLSAFRYQRPAGAAPPQMAFTVKRFTDAGVLAAIADRATATTLVTSEGRALTEVQLQMRNRTQPFLRVELPAGATIVSVDLAGQSAKPATGADGTRIPLMRAGLSTSNPYTVSFVYVHAGTPFQKKGDIQMSLPKMDVPVGLVRWEVFVPEQYSARAIDGNVIDIHRFPVSPLSGGVYYPAANAAPLPMPSPKPAKLLSPVGVMPGQIRGRVVDGSGSVMPGVTVNVRIGGYTTTVVSDDTGTFMLANMPHGTVEMTSSLAGFRTHSTTFPFDGNPKLVEIDMDLGMVTETVTVSADSPLIDTSTATTQWRFQAESQQQTRPQPQTQPLVQAPSMNVINLQQRAAGVLPIRVDVPRAGISHEFVKPLVVGDSPVVTLRYKRN